MRTVTRRFPRSPEAIGEARQFVGEVLARWWLSEHTDDVLLCVSELATNSLHHAVPRGTYFVVAVMDADDLLRIEVHDMSRLRPRVEHPDSDQDHGRGLLLVESLSDNWGVKPRVPRGKSVWVEFKVTNRSSRTTPQVGLL